MKSYRELRFFSKQFQYLSCISLLYFLVAIAYAPSPTYSQTNTKAKTIPFSKEIFKNKIVHNRPIMTAYHFLGSNAYMTICEEKRFAIWNARTFKLKRHFSLSKRTIYKDTAVSHDQRWLGCISENEIMVWRSQELLNGNNKPHKTLDFKNANEFDWSWDGNYLAVSGDNHMVTIYETANFKIAFQIDTRSHGNIHDLKWSADGKRLYTSHHGIIREWILDDVILRQAAVNKNTATRYWFFDGHRTRLITNKSGVMRGRRYLWLKGHARLSISPDGYMLSGQNGKTVKIWEINSANLRFQWTVPEIYKSRTNHYTTKHNPAKFKWFDNESFIFKSSDGRLLAADLKKANAFEVSRSEIPSQDLLVDIMNERILSVGIKNHSLDAISLFGQFYPETDKINLFENDTTIWKRFATGSIQNSQLTFRHIIELSTSQPVITLDWLNKHLQAMFFKTNEDIQCLINELSTDDAATKEAALIELRHCHLQAFTLICHYLNFGELPSDASQKLKTLRDERLDGKIDGQTIRAARIIELIDRIHTPSARQLLLLISNKPGEHPLKPMAKRLLSNWNQSHYANNP